MRYVLVLNMSTNYLILFLLRNRAQFPPLWLWTVLSNSVQTNNFGKSDHLQPLRLDHKRHCSFHFVFFWITCLGKSVAMLWGHLSSTMEKSIWWEIKASHQEPARSQILLPTELSAWVFLGLALLAESSLQLTSVMVNILITFWDPVNHKHQSRLLPNSQPIETVR